LAIPGTAVPPSAIATTKAGTQVIKVISPLVGAGATTGATAIPGVTEGITGTAAGTGAGSFKETIVPTSTVSATTGAGDTVRAVAFSQPGASVQTFAQLEIAAVGAAPGISSRINAGTFPFRAIVLSSTMAVTYAGHLFAYTSEEEIYADVFMSTPLCAVLIGMPHVWINQVSPILNMSITEARILTRTNPPSASAAITIPKTISGQLKPNTNVDAY